MANTGLIYEVNNRGKLRFSFLDTIVREEVCPGGVCQIGYFAPDELSWELAGRVDSITADEARSVLQSEIEDLTPH